MLAMINYLPPDFFVGKSRKTHLSGYTPYFKTIDAVNFCTFPQKYSSHSIFFDMLIIRTLKYVRVNLFLGAQILFKLGIFHYDCTKKIQ